MKNIKPCGACSFMRVECLDNCFWAPYIKPGEVEKFSLLVEDTSVDSFKAKVKKCKIDSRQKYIDNQYEKKMKIKHEKAEAVCAADSESLIQHVDVAVDSLNHHEGRVVHDFGIGLKTRKRVPTPLSAKACSNVAGDSLNHCEWSAIKRVCTEGPTKPRSFSFTPIAEKAVDLSDNPLLLLACCTENFEFADTFSEEDRTKILELKKQHEKIWLRSMLSEMVNDMVQKAQAKKEQASLRNEKAEQSEKEQASLRNERAEQAGKEQASLGNEKAKQAEKEQAERSEK